MKEVGAELNVCKQKAKVNQLVKGKEEEIAFILRGGGACQS